MTALVAASELTEQADVTNWPARLALVLVVLAVIGLAVWGMWRGWQHRAGRQGDLPAPPPPVLLEDPWVGPVEGVYLASTTAGNWLDRVVVHGLGVRSRADLSVGAEGVLMAREGADDVFVPADRVRAVRLDRGIAGAVYEQGGVLVLTWVLGDGTLLDTGFRAVRTQEHVRVVEAVRRLLPVREGGTA